MKLYRYEGRTISQGYMDEFDNWHSAGSKVVLNLNELEVLKETEKGYWIESSRLQSSKKMTRFNFIGQEYEVYVTFVLKGDGKRYAYPSKEAALHSFKKRKERQILILSSQLKYAKVALEFAQKFEI